MIDELNVKRGAMRIYGKLFLPEGEGPFPVVVFSHGLGSSHIYDGDLWSVFTERGIAFVAFDFCGGLASQSDGTMLDMSVLTEAADLEAVIDAVGCLDEIDPGCLFLVGNSQGGYVSAYVAAKRPADVRALVLNFPAFCIGDDATKLVERASDDPALIEEASYGDLPIGKRYLQDAMEVDIFDVIGKYDGDVLIVHGSDDEIVPPEYSLRAARVYGASAELVVLGGMRHGFRNSLPEHFRRATSLAIDFIIDHLV